MRARPCSVPGCGETGRGRCSVCKVLYCGISCQENDWPQHKLVCSPPPPLEWQKINGQIGMSDGMSQSMLGGGLSVHGGGAAAGGGMGRHSFGYKNADLVYGVIKQSMDEAGCNRDIVFNQAKKTMSRADMDNALDFLSSEGHIYSTIDEDHFKTTDGD